MKKALMKYASCGCISVDFIGGLGGGGGGGTVMGGDQHERGTQGEVM